MTWPLQITVRRPPAVRVEVPGPRLGAVLRTIATRLFSAISHPLTLLSIPAGVAIWGGWVTLGGLCGFGKVDLLPGIVGGLTVNLSITLPFGMEAYGTYAVAAAVNPATPRRARWFAGISAVLSLLLGAAGQVTFHLLQAEHKTRAPVPIIVAVACVPVLVVGLGAVLHALIHIPARVRPVKILGPVPWPRAGAPAARPAAVKAGPDVKTPPVKTPAKKDRAPAAPRAPRPQVARTPLPPGTSSLDAARARQAAQAAAVRERARQILAGNPDMTNRELGERLSKSERQARRIRGELREQANEKVSGGAH